MCLAPVDDKSASRAPPGGAQEASKPAAGPDGAQWAESHGLGKRTGFMNMQQTLNDVLCLLLIASTPLLAVYMYVINAEFDGSVAAFAQFARSNGLAGVQSVWPKQSVEAWTYFLSFGLLEAVLLLVVPGKAHIAPTTPKGNTPIYKANGVQCYLITLALFFGSWYAGVFNPARVYDIFGSILVGLNVFAFLFCWGLYFKGVYFPSSSDHGSTGSILYDFYWGRELHPRLLGNRFDVKHWTNCRFGMMAWAVLVLCFAAKQYETLGHLSGSMLVTVVLLETYIFKFFLWEAGYLNTMDVAHDRAGYYTQWGCMVFVPGIYTSPAMFMVKHPVALSPLVTAGLLALGLAAIYINYDIDRQRQVFRAAGGKCTIWGAPAQYITAKYTTAAGDKRTSLLLASGWWAVARHLHYLPELSAAFLWSCGAGFSYFLPFFYLIFLTIVLVDRALRDESKCAAKYGPAWDEYCRRVPWKILPGVW